MNPSITCCLQFLTLIMNRRASTLGITWAAAVFSFCVHSTAAEPVYDVVIYGSTPAAVAAAVQVRKMGKTVVVVSPETHLGGMSTGGLSFNDWGKKEAIGGYAREFYHQIRLHYLQDSSWTWEPRWPKLELKAKDVDPSPVLQGMRRFEPHVAEEIFEATFTKMQVPFERNEWLERSQGVEKAGAQIKTIRMLSGKTYSGRVFIDATYEGDLMATAGVSYTVGRESNSQYGETLNGNQIQRARQQADLKIDPFIVRGNPASGLLPRISQEAPGEEGEGDQRLQAYCFRICVTRVPENRIPFPKPAKYDPSQYELALRLFETGWDDVFHKFDKLPNGKVDVNNYGPFSFNNVGYNYDYPEASYERRKEIIEEHKTYQMGLLYFLANDERVPQEIRVEMSAWGLAKDEFQDHGGWPHQLYIREARRMVGAYVMREQDCMGLETAPCSVGMGSYNIDSHFVQRYVDADGRLINEGKMEITPPKPYPIGYGAITPRESECENLLVPVCCSSTHVAYGSIRMEPVFMVLGQSAAIAASIAVDQQVSVQRIPYEVFSQCLIAEGQVLTLPGPVEN